MKSTTFLIVFVCIACCGRLFAQNPTTSSPEASAILSAISTAEAEELKTMSRSVEALSQEAISPTHSDGEDSPVVANRDNPEWPKDGPNTADTIRLLDGLRLEKAAIGYLATDQKQWSAWTGKDGRADLSGLPQGRHWLISEWPLSVIPVELPNKQFLERQELRFGTPPQIDKNATWRDYPVQLTVETNEAGKEFIRVDITNQTDEPLSFSELDLSIGSKGRGIAISGYSPLWLEDDLTKTPRIEVAARQSGSFRIDWSQWAQRGVWNTHSGLPINLPSAPADPPGRIRVGLHGPVFGSKPLELTHPEMLVATADKPNSPAAIDIQVVDAETNLPVSGGVANIRFTLDGWAEKTVDKLISQDQIDLTNDGKFPISIPDELLGRHSYVQVSIMHPEYVIEQSFGSWSVTPEMSTNAAFAQEKLFGGGVIKLKRGHEISGQVLGPNGKPTSNVKLYAAMQMPEYLNMPPHAFTDREGRFKFRVPSRDGYRLFMISPDVVSASIPIRKGYGEHPPIKLEGGTVISGQVFGADGKPLGDVVVQGNGSDSVYTGFPNPMSRVKTDAEGRYSLPPMKLSVDVRVAPLGWLGGWSLRGRDLTQDLVFLPKLFKPTPDGPLPKATLNFHTAETVTLTARVYDEQGQPATRCDIAIFGTVPDEQPIKDQRGPFWRGQFRGVPEQPGLFQVKAPKGLLNATLVDAEVPAGPRQKWSRAVREGENMKGSRTDAGWSVLDRDDHSIVVGEPATLSDSGWRRVSPHKVVWNSDRTSQIRQDSSVQLESENNWQDFTLLFRKSELPTGVQTMRLELLPSPNSRATSDSNVMLFDVKPHLENSKGKITQLEFEDCQFSGNPNDDSAANCIDFLSDTGWKVPDFPSPGSSHQLILKFAEPIELDDGDMFGVTIDAGGSPELGVLTRVRLSFADIQPN